MPDPADNAAPVIEAFLARSEQAARGRSGPESHPGFDGAHCVEEKCGVAIPAGRLALGKVRCVDCQTILEKRR